RGVGHERFKALSRVVAPLGVQMERTRAGGRVSVARKVELKRPRPGSRILLADGVHLERTHAGGRVQEAGGVVLERAVATGRILIARDVVLKRIHTGGGIVYARHGGVPGEPEEGVCVGERAKGKGRAPQIEAGRGVDRTIDIQRCRRSRGSNTNVSARLKNRGVTNGDVGWGRRRKDRYVAILGVRAVHDSVDSNPRLRPVGRVSRGGCFLLGCTTKNEQQGGQSKSDAETAHK